jgi:murein L,D-transpeptidase YafK
MSLQRFKRGGAAVAVVGGLVGVAALTGLLPDPTSASAPAPRTLTPSVAPAITPSTWANHLPEHSDSAAEARLVGVYRLVSQGNTRKALAEAQNLARDYPHFQLAHLAVGDLLLSRSRGLRQLGDIPAAEAPPSSTLQELRDESLQRVTALKMRPPVGSVPAQFLELPPSYKHAIAIDAARSRLYLFENSAQGMKLVADFYSSVGKLGIEKVVEGDQRTPLGVYFITSRLDPKGLRDFYGSGALPINYPNPLDQSRGKTGSGIWLHGTPPNQFSRAPLATDGCVVLANPDLERILRTVAPRSTPVVIAKQLQWVQPGSMQAERLAFEATLDAWRTAKTNGDMQQLMNFYAPNFQGHKNKPLQEWVQVLQAETKALQGRQIQLKDKSYLRWTDSADTMVVTFGEVAEGARSGPVKRQYWMRNGQQWQIFFEGVIG